MAKLIALVFFLLSCILIVPPTTYARLNALTTKKPTEKFAKIHFYVQDLLGGPNPTVYEIASASITSGSPTEFGLVRAVDDLLTAEPADDSETVGRVQGLVTSADLETYALAMNLNFYFTSGKYKGSTISILGRNPLGDKEREVAVVGGTGVFRGARGYAITSTYSHDDETNNNVLEYTLYVTYSGRLHADV